MKLRFLTDYAELDTHFPRLATLFELVASKATHGEYGAEDLYRLAQQDHITIGMIKQGGRMQLAIAFEFIAYPRFTVVNTSVHARFASSTHKTISA